MTGFDAPWAHACLAVPIPTAARLLGVSARTVERALKDGLIESVTIRRRRVIPVLALERFLAQPLEHPTS